MEEKWIMLFNGETRNIFNNREEAVKHLKELLKQTLKDFDKQDKKCEYDYSIHIHEIIMKPIEKRESFLGL